jgi:hypothetical protein
LEVVPLAVHPVVLVALAEWEAAQQVAVVPWEAGSFLRNTIYFVVVFSNK